MGMSVYRIVVVRITNALTNNYACKHANGIQTVTAPVAASVIVVVIMYVWAKSKPVTFAQTTRSACLASVLKTV